MRPTTAQSVLLSILLLGGCDPVEQQDPDLPAEPDTLVRPTDLELTVTVVGADATNPHGDGSGQIELRVTATDAVRYRFRVDDVSIESPSGEADYTLQSEGVVEHTITATAVASSGLDASVTQTVTVYQPLETYPTLVWADEFDGSGSPNPAKWHHQVIPPLEDGWFNNEEQHYTDRTDNSHVSDGTLKITALREDYETHGTTLPYTSARLNSKFAFTYGRVEVRARLPSEGGTWPAIWTLGANVDEVGNYFGDEYGSVGWPACGEIDIMEQKGDDKDRTLAYFHWGNTQTSAYESEGSTTDNPDATTDFHVYSLYWSDKSMQVYVDDELVHELANTESRPFDNPHYLLLNIAMGGNLGGEIPESFERAALEIDYVRVYQ